MRRPRANLISIPRHSDGGGRKIGGLEGGVHGRREEEMDAGSARPVLRVNEATVADGDSNKALLLLLLLLLLVVVGGGGGVVLRLPEKDGERGRG